MPASPHFYLNSFLRGLVTATTDDVLQNADQNDDPSEVVSALANELEDLTEILTDIYWHLRDQEQPDEYDPQQELNYYAGLEL